MTVCVSPPAGRNAPCPCGSGKKYKRCCGIAEASSQGQSFQDLHQRALKLAEAGNFPAAAEAYRQDLRLRPTDVVALAGLGQCLCWMREEKEGLALLRRAARKLAVKARKNGDPTALLQMAAQLQHWGDVDTSLNLARQAIALQPDSFNAFHVLALGLARINRRDEALEAARRANRMASDEPNPAVHRAVLEGDAGNLDTARKLLESVIADCSPARQPRAYLELGRVLDKLGAYDEAFERLVQAGQGQLQQPEVKALDPEFTPSLISKQREGFVRGGLQRPAMESIHDDLPAPVFLLGFFRSGTTLTQQVLDAHPCLVIADEPDFIYDVRTELARITHDRGMDIAARLEKLDRDGIGHLRRYYWQAVENRLGFLPRDKVFVDKTTMNSIDIGMIDFLFPEAKVIFALRDPRDILISAFMQSMRPTATTLHLLTWEGIARLYCGVMGLWLQLRPRLRLQHIELRYEDAVTDFRTTYEQVFEFLGLDWPDSADEFYQLAADKVISTPSFSDVSRPLYQSSVGRWCNYAGHYRPVAELLRPFIETFGYTPF